MIDALLDSRARGGQQCAALRELWTVICTALEITAAQECERVVANCELRTFRWMANIPRRPWRGRPIS